MRKPLFGELFVDNAGADRTAIHLYESQPSPLELSNLGTVFVIGELENTSVPFEEILDEIDHALTSAYYRSSDFDVEAAFERALHRVNKSVQDLIGQFGEEWTYQYNAVLGVIHGDTIHLSYVGNIEAYLVQKQQIIDILQKDPRAEIKPLKLFSTLVSGQCVDDTRIVLATNSLLDFVSLDSIRRTVFGNSALDSAQKLEETLTSSQHSSNIAALIIQNELESLASSAAHTAGVSTDMSDTPSIETGGATDDIQAALNDEFSMDDADGESPEEVANDSMYKLVEQEQATDELLTPSIWPTIKKRLGNWTTRPVPETASSQTSATQEHPAIKYIKLTASVIGNILMQIVLGFVWVVKYIVRWFQQNQSIRNAVQTSAKGASNWFLGLSMARRIFLVVAVALLVFFMFSVLLRDKSNTSQGKEDAYISTLAQVENSLGEVDSKQIMKDEAGANAAFQQAKDLLATVPADSDAYATKGAELAGRIQALENQYNKVEQKDDLRVVGDFNEVAKDAPVTKLTVIGSNVYGFSANGTVYRLPFDGGPSKSVDGTGNDIADVENDSVATSVTALKNNTLQQYNPVLEQYSEVPITMGDSITGLRDIDIFGSRLYALDAGSKQIYRFERSGDAYGSGSSWIKADGALNDPVSFDIDGSVYVLESDGSIKKFDAGDSSDFTVGEFSPSLAGSTELVKTGATSGFIIVNPTTNRLVFLDNNGALERQVTSSQFNAISAISYSATNNTVYILSGTQVLELAL